MPVAVVPVGVDLHHQRAHGRVHGHDQDRAQDPDQLQYEKAGRNLVCG